MKQIVTLICIVLFSGCQKEAAIEMYKCNNLFGQPEYMYFKTPKEGYVFVTSGMPIPGKKSNEYGSNTIDIATIYKTSDGGNNWVKINELENNSYYNTAIYINDCIYIQLINSKEILKSNLVKFNLNNFEVRKLRHNFERMGNIWFNNKIFVDYSTKEKDSLLFVSEDFNLIETNVGTNKKFKGNTTTFNKNSYVLTWDNQLFNITKNKTIFKSDNELVNITQQNTNHIIIAGSKKTEKSTIELISYNVDTGKTETLETLENYSIIDYLQTNDKVIAGFVGNIKGLFVEYDLLYSLDKGKTWHIQELQESKGVKPSCLVDNIMYVYCYDGRMQKITF